ncbi:MAG: RNA polymerase sigma factor [Elusimicrobia bacterium]|nr:RNA polymerase sigma factor [Elusimicrobiota bacterium]
MDPVTSHQMEEPEEGRWIALAREGDAAAFGRLITAYQRKVYGFVLGFVRREDVADELTQEAFLRAWKALHAFRGESAFQTWLFQISINIVRDWGRRQKWRALREIPLFWREREDEEGPADPMDRLEDKSAEASPGRGAESLDLKRRLEAAVDRLPAREREVFVLRHYQNLHLADVARTLNVAEGTVKAHLFHALSKLRKLLEREFHEL